jgi:starvation-inducible DNA-binding protein
MKTEIVKEGKIDINIGLPKEPRHGVIEILNNTLCDEYILFTKTRNYHWNVVGPDFGERHKFFQEQYEAIDEIIDEVAERVRQLNGMSLGTLSEFIQHGRIKENPIEHPDDRIMISNLLTDHEQIIRKLRTDADKCDDEYHDMGTNDFLIGVMEKHEKMAWMLRAHTEKA